MHRPTAALAGLLAASLLALPASPDTRAAAAPVDPQLVPLNIVVVMADDMRADDVRFMPAVHRLVAERGLSYRNSFSPYPLCCPARASFLTGQYAHNHGVLSNTRPWGFGGFDDRATIASALEKAGYHTAMVGKYLNEYGRARSSVTGRSSLRYVPNGWSDWYVGLQPPKRSGIEGSVYNYRNTPYNVNGRVDASHRGEYQTNTLGRFSRRLVTRYSASPKPFFLYVSALAPHKGGPGEPDDRLGRRFPTPARPAWVRGRFDATLRKSPGVPTTGPTEADISDKPRYLRRKKELTKRDRRSELALTRQRAESLFVLDREVAKLVRTLKKTGEYDDTVIMFTSDNGHYLGEHRLRTGKISGYEPSIRVPLLIAGRGVPQGVRYQPARTFDLSATILDLAGAEPPHPLDGHSLVDGFVADEAWAFPVITEGIVGGPAYIGNKQKRARGFLDARSSIGIRTARWKLTRYSNGESELYDLETDPHELTNLAHDPAYAKVLDRLVQQWWRYKDCKATDCLAPLPDSLATSADETATTTQVQSARVEERNAVSLWPAPLP